MDDLITSSSVHTAERRRNGRLAAPGETSPMTHLKVFWKCGLITTVMSGVDADREHPAMIAGLYNSYLERQKEADEEPEKEAETA